MINYNLICDFTTKAKRIIGAVGMHMATAKLKLDVCSTAFRYKN
jgi:hypothetical protein